MHCPAVFEVPLIKEDISHQITKRSDFLNINLTDKVSDFYAYYANFTFGSPPQTFKAYLQTYGNGCWLMSADNWECQLYKDPSSCDGYGGYNQSTSTTAKKLDEKFSYDDNGVITNGDFVTDVLTIGGVKVDNMKMGIVGGNAVTSNTLSLGYGNTSSTSLTQALVDAGAINSPAFSLWSESVLFGGVNKAKYNGSLHTFPIVNGSDLSKALRINMDGISINGTSAASSEFPIDAVFDNRIAMTYAPKAIVEALTSHFSNVSVPDELGQVNFSCSSVSENATIEFKFGDLELQFYLDEFIGHQSDMLDAGGYSTEDDTCFFTIAENVDKDLQKQGSIVLGTNFMSLIYSVFDLENGEVSLAKRNSFIVPDDIVEIKSGKNGVPGAKKSSASSGVGSGLTMCVMLVAVAMVNLTL
ncbi:hypothetical protein VI817_010280 [Penicillium citrinum]|nr:hypothetical protein VI817_010280 [Penicillium citrinum]